MYRKICKIFKTYEYKAWFLKQPTKEQEQIRKRLSYIEVNAYFGDHKLILKDGSIWELRWKNGRRIYYTCFFPQSILLLLGGNKNGQSYDITEAKRIYTKTTKTEPCILS